MTQQLEDSGSALLAALDGVTEEQARLRPGPEKWSIFEIVEHLAISEAGMFRGLASARPVETSLRDPEKAARWFEKISGGAQPIEAPEHVRPAGRFPDLEHARAAFEANRQRTIEYVIENGSALDFITVKHPLAGVVSGTEMLAIMAGHVVRHTKQIWALRS